jgi:hypothetical protein
LEETKKNLPPTPVNIDAEVDSNNSDFGDFEDPINNAHLDLHWRRQK